MSLNKLVSTSVKTAFLLALSLLIFQPSTASAKYASYVVEVSTGKVLHSVNADTRNYPASLTKMMTLYMIFDALKKGDLWLHEELVVSRRATWQPPSRLGLGFGQTITVEKAIYALVTKSANDVAVTVAENIGKTERAFALKMTSMARKLGMKRTIFRNASGLPHRGQMSTARDMSVLARRLMKDFPQYYHYFSTQKFKYGGRTYKNHNKLLSNYDGADGIKTGYIRASGFNLVASVERDGRRVVGVVFGGKTSKRRDKHMAQLLNKGFTKLTGKTQYAKMDNKAKSKRKSQQTATRVIPGQAIARTSPRHSWAVQVGAYHKPHLAANLAEDALEKVSKIAKNGKVRVVPLRQRRGKTVYRARIVNVTKKEAFRSCRVLKRNRMDCMETRAQGPIEVALND
ncbi:MAG: D-alanyl-D-alanine carboxypeptidase [Alphaproteobacteria bacterium]|nr:D-alanyl-D-alanine carboxypeptidase [Alphaproteobacteria bacterium]